MSWWPSPCVGIRFPQRADAVRPRRALVGAYTVPEPDRDSGSRRIVDTIEFLQETGWSVTFATTTAIGRSRHADALRRRGVALFHAGPAELARHVRSVDYQIALLAFWPTAELFVPVIREASPETRVVIDSIDVHFVRHARRIFGLSGATGILDSPFGEQVVGELNAYAAADVVLTVSRKEADLIDDLLGEPGLSMVVPDNEEVTLGPSFRDRRGILFVGSFRHPPNIDAVAWLATEIVPFLPASLLGVHPVSIVGDALDDRIRALAQGLRGVRMVGWVPSLTPYYNAARASILPLRSGAGTKRKLIQSLAHGLPVVSTSIGAEGLALVNGRDAIIADDARSFAASVERLVYDERLWKSLSTKGRKRVLEAHGREVARRALQAAIDAALARPAKQRRLPDATYEQHHQRLVYQHEQRLIVPYRPPIEVVAGRSESGDGMGSGESDRVRLIAFYLPQFHSIPENDRWWGEGFTEWTMVRRAQALFPGHLQPRVPTELGYYDLSDPEIRWRQAELARDHGIHGFCYYHYWFNGTRLLHRPFEEVLQSGEPDLPFAVCWANEPWSRRWHGREEDVLQPQAYSAEDDRAHIRALLPALADPRAIKVRGKPLVIIYRGFDLPDAARLADTWRTEVAKAGLPGLHLLTVETGWDKGWDATRVGFDGKVRFQPEFSTLSTVARVPQSAHPSLRVFSYDNAWPVLRDLPQVPYRTYEAVFPGWDNSPRRGADGWVVHGATPESYGTWLRAEIERATSLPPGERLLFINAWNEWGEGAYLEPDEAFGRGYLEATLRVARSMDVVATDQPEAESTAVRTRSQIAISS